MGKGAWPRAALARWEVREKRALETGSEGKPRTSCCCPLLPWLQVLWGSLEFRRHVPVGEEEGEGKGVHVLPTGGVYAGTFVFRGFKG